MCTRGWGRQSLGCVRLARGRLRTAGGDLLAAPIHATRQSFPKIQRGAASLPKVGPTRRTARHPWRPANTNLPGRYPAGAPLGSPPPEHHPYLVSTRRAAQGWGKAPCRGALPLAKAGRGGPPHAFGSCAHGAAAGPLPRLRPTRRTRARQPTRLAVAATLRAVVAVHLRRLLPTLNGAGALQNHPAGRVPQHTLRALAASGRRAESSQHDASPGW
jgi:hypothetical protein